MAQTPDLVSALLSAHHWIVVILTAVLTGTAVFVHYEALERLNFAMPRLRVQPRPRMLILIIAIIAVHIAEIWIFSLGIYVAVQYPELGGFTGTGQLMFLDAVYVSAVTYTTIGYGDLAPVGPIRLIMGTEALVGFVMLTWSASFTYLEMQRFWRPR